MARYSQTKIQKLLRESDDAGKNDLKGAKLEELVRYLFCKIPHVKHYESNIVDQARAHEMDVVFLNDTRHSELYFLGTSEIITECKNTADRVSSAEVGWFVRKLQNSAASCGILIALSGITGEADGTSNAHDEILNAFTRDRIQILVIRRDDILAFRTTSDLAELLQRKIMLLRMQRIIV
jgi:restriction endonuclease